MNQQELVKAVADEAGLPQVGVESTLKALGKVTQQQLKYNGDVTLPGIGKVSSVAKPACERRNPRTGEAVQVAAKNAPKFSASKALKDAIN